MSDTSLQQHLKNVENSLKRFKECLTPEQASLYETMLSTRSDLQKFQYKNKQTSNNAHTQAQNANVQEQLQALRQELDVTKKQEIADAVAIEAAKKEPIINVIRETQTIKEVQVPVIKEVQTIKEIHITNEPNVSSPPLLPTTFSITAPVASKTQTRQHFLFPLVLKAINARCNVWLVGPAGSGKSVLTANVAAELGLPYVSLSVCGQTTKTDLLGYVDANGVYRGTCFRQAYEFGGVFCLDEVDNGNANVLAILNSALSSDTTTFPDKAIEKHKDFIVVACANTFGLGATNGYVGRTQIDAATLDRFFFIEMPYDEGLEAFVANVECESPRWNTDDDIVPTNSMWLSKVKKTRNLISKLGIKTIISPRATYIGLALIEQEVPLQYLEKGLLYKGLSLDTITKIRRTK